MHRVLVGGEFRRRRFVPVQIDHLARRVVDADRKSKRHERSIRDLNAKMKTFRDNNLRRELRRKIDHMRTDIRVLEQELDVDRRTDPGARAKRDQ